MEIEKIYADQQRIKMEKELELMKNMQNEEIRQRTEELEKVARSSMADSEKHK